MDSTDETLTRAMRVIRRLWRQRTTCIASNESQWRTINALAARNRALGLALDNEVRERFPRTAMSNEDVAAYLREEYGIDD